MIYTKEQINEIKRRLSVLGIKDTDIRELDSSKAPITGKETVVIVKNGENVRVPIGSLIPVTMLEDVRLVTEGADEPYLYFVFKTTEGSKTISVNVGTLIAGLDSRVGELEESLNSLNVKEEQDISTLRAKLEELKSQLTAVASTILLLNSSTIPTINNKYTALERRVNRLEYTIDNLDTIIRADYESEAIRTLKDEPDAYLRNVHYDISNNEESYIINYLSENLAAKRLDQPLPVKLYEAGDLVVYPDKAAEKQISYRTHNSDEYYRYIYNLIPGRRYFYTINDVWKSFVLKKTRRFIFAGNVQNVRDLGGIPVEGGGYIAYDKIFRGSEISGNTIGTPNPDAQHFLNSLGITLDLDLREGNEIGESALNPTLNNAFYENIPFIRFDQIINLDDTVKEKIKSAFEAIANEVLSGGKVYIHCVWGFHRAGLLCSIIEGVLGAKQCEIDKDYELSTFSTLGRVSRTDDNYKEGVSYLNSTFEGSWVRLLAFCGVSRELITAFKNAMIVDINSKDKDEIQYYEITHKELVNLRDNKFLVPGAKYRIIDYDTYDGLGPDFAACSGIEDLPSFKSAYHPFDLVVTAISTDELDCNAKAVHSKRDIAGYFDGQDLSKWELKYDLDNNKEKYSWAVDDDVPVGIVKVPQDVLNYQLPVEHYYSISYMDSQVVLRCTRNTFIVSESNDPYLPAAESGTFTFMSGGYMLIDTHSNRVTYPIDAVFHYTLEDAYKHIEGKGVIYYMKDENNNELPYDFKNILFLYANNWINTFTRKIPYEYPSIIEGYSPIETEGRYVTYSIHLIPSITSIISLELDKPRSFTVWQNSARETSINSQVISTLDTRVMDAPEGRIDIGITMISASPEQPEPDNSPYYIYFRFIVDSIEDEYVPIISYSTVIKPWIENSVQHLNKNIFVTNSEEQIIENNFFDNNTHNNTLTGDVINCQVGKYSCDNIIRNAENCKLGDDSVNNTINPGNNFYLGNSCHDVKAIRGSISKYVVIDDFISNKNLSIDSEYYKYLNSDIVSESVEESSQ